MDMKYDVWVSDKNIFGDPQPESGVSVICYANIHAEQLDLLLKLTVERGMFILVGPRKID